jgi:hypothetical protein
VALFNRYETVLANVRAVFGLLSLEKPSVAVASSDLEVVQVVDMLTAKGRELGDEFQWQQFQRRGAVTIGPSTENGVLLPEDWAGFISHTGWNESGDTKLIGPLDAAQWQHMLVTDVAGSNFNLRYRVKGSQLYFEDYPADDTEISFEYYSRGWVQDFDESEVVLKDFCENDGDIVLFDSLLIQYAVRLQWLESKNFDTRAAQKDFNRRWAAVTSRDKDAPILTLHRRAGARLLNVYNIPESGFGSS